MVERGSLSGSLYWSHGTHMVITLSCSHNNSLRLTVNAESKISEISCPSHNFKYHGTFPQQCVLIILKTERTSHGVV